MSELLLGCGHSRQKRLCVSGRVVCEADSRWRNLYTLDNNRDVDPDIVLNMGSKFWDIPYSVRTNSGSKRASYCPDEFHEIHAYEVLEHLGSQGDYLSFFSTFTNIYRLLKPNGYLMATVPSRFGPWAWGDPGHRRIISAESLTFLDQTTYEQCGITTMSDYRWCYKSDFRKVWDQDDRITYRFILQAVKPARIKV